MKLYLILCISGIDVLCHTAVGESYEDVFDKEIKGLEFDAVSDNLPGLKLFGINPRKVAADVYIDDAMYGK